MDLEDATYRTYDAGHTGGAIRPKTANPANSLRSVFLFKETVVLAPYFLRNYRELTL